MKKATFKVRSPRRLPDPTSGIDRHIWLVPALEVPPNLPKDANPRAQNTDRAVYKKVRQSLMNEDCDPNTFHLKNKGITILAERVDKLASEPDGDVFELWFQGDKQGVVDGGHTYEIIVTSQDSIAEYNRGLDEDEVPIEQYVKVEVLTGVPDTLATDIAGGLNTAVQVQEFTLMELDNKFDWIRAELRASGFGSAVSFKQNELGKPYDVKDILTMIDLFNVADFPVGGSRQPTRTCTSEAQVLKAFKDNEEQYKRLRNLLPDVLRLHDIIASTAGSHHNAMGGRAGRLEWMKKYKARDFAFINTTASDVCVPYKGALYPMIAAFRCFVKLDERTDAYQWVVPFEKIIETWNKVAPRLTETTQETSSMVGRRPDAIAKTKQHWANLANIVEMEYLRSS